MTRCQYKNAIYKTEGNMLLLETSFFTTAILKYKKKKDLKTNYMKMMEVLKT